MSLKEQLKEDLKTAMRDKDVVKRDSIRSINTMIKQIEVDERKDLNDEDNQKTKVINELSLKDIIEEQLKYFEILASKKKISLTTNLVDFKYKINEDDFLRVFNNLVSNAIKYNKMNGKLEIILSNNILTIKDTGIGIEKEKISNIFNRYYRATSEQGGFGIGLNIVNKICKNYNIKIDVESKLNEGTTFTLIFKNPNK